MQRADVAVGQLVVGHDRDRRHLGVDQRQRAVLELGGLVGLGVPVGDLLELLRALARDREAAHPARRRTGCSASASRTATSASSSSRSRISAIWPGSAVSPEISRLPSAIDRSRTRPSCSASSAKPEEHVGQRLGRRHRHLGPGVQVDPAVALARDRAADDVDQADDPAALAPDLLHGEQGVDGLAGLADRDVQRVRLDDRVAVAELARRLGVGRDPGQLLDQRGAHLADVVRRAAAQDLHPADRTGVAGVHVQPAETGGPEPLVEPPAQHPLGGLGLLEDLLVHERRVVAGVVRRGVDVELAGLLAGARCRSSRYVVKPVAVTVASSPSSRWATVVVWRTSAARSEATYISWSPTPTISGLPLRATTIRSGKSACITAMP